MSNQTVVTKADIGKPVVFFDPVGKPFPALITQVWGPQCINLVIVTDDPTQQDSYGHKLARHTSLMHGSIQQAHGYFWMLPGEERAAKAE